MSLRTCILVTVLLLSGGRLFADENVVQMLTGTESVTTPTFKVQDRWEVRWSTSGIMSLTVFSADGAVVTGSAGLSKGSVYLPKGGSYYLKVETKAAVTAPSPDSGMNSRDNFPPPSVQYGWKVSVVELGPPSFVPNPNSGTDYVPPAVDSTTVATTAPGSAPGNASPNPFSSPAPTSGTASPVVGKLSAAQSNAVVLIEGDNSAGTGFLVKTPTGTCVITNLHVLENNPNIRISSTTGGALKMLSAKGAADRDLAMLLIQDANLSCVELAPDMNDVQTGDEVITPGNSQGGQVMLNTTGKVVAVGPERIEIDNPIYHGNSGGPVFHTKSGKVLGVVTEVAKVDMTSDLDKVSFASRNSAISSTMRYFALRPDTVKTWVDIDWRRFQIETQFLDEFHEQSRRLDSYLNANNGSAPSRNDDNAKLYRRDEKIMRANDNFVSAASGGDTAQRIEALRGLVFDLDAVADFNMDQIQNSNNFYPFDQERARDEAAYRKALKSEIGSLGNDVDRIGHLPRSNN